MTRIARMVFTETLSYPCPSVPSVVHYLCIRVGLRDLGLRKIPFAAGEDSGDNLRAMKLRQNQVWKVGDEFLRIVALERLEVQYKSVTNPATGDRKHHRVTKKEFCRLIKSATLLTPAEETDLRAQ